MLEVSDLTVRYGGATAVLDVSVTAAAGSITGIIGPNGAGKTSMIDAICGISRSSGSVVLDGQELSRLRAYRRIRAGLARTFQSMELFEDLTVAENVEIASRVGRLSGGGLFRRGAPSTDRPGRPGSVLERFGLGSSADLPVSELSLGQRRLVGIARALAGQPKVLLLDEPAAGLDTTESLQLGETLRTLARSGLAVVLVDHDMGLVLSVCETIHVLNFGEVISSGSAQSIRRDPRVIEAYLGKTHSEAGDVVPDAVLGTL